MLKQEARKKFHSQRMEMSISQKEKFDDLLLIQFQKLHLPPLQAILSYLPIEEKREINTLLITGFLKFRNPGLLVCYPKTELFQNTMQAVLTNDDTDFKQNSYGILEPVDDEFFDALSLDVVLVPMLAFDKVGNRVGYGKGFYDRFLQTCHADCLKIGLSYFEAVDAIKDAGKFDIPLDYCITPQKIYVF